MNAGFSYGRLKKAVRNGQKIARTAFAAIRKGICDQGLTLILKHEMYTCVCMYVCVRACLYVSLFL